MIANAKRLFSGVVMLTAAGGALSAPALARPLLNSDLPADLRDDAIKHHRPTVQAALATATPGYEAVGIATFYRSSKRFFRTSSGERYDEMGMTAASPTLPLGTHVRVTRQDTGESIVVRINDRSGQHGSRIIDLSYGAARRLGIHGIGRVSVAEVAPDQIDAGRAPVEVAEAPDDAVPVEQSIRATWRHHGSHHHATHLTRRHGPRHKHHAHQAAASVRPSNHVQFVALTRHSAPPRAERHRL